MKSLIRFGVALACLVLVACGPSGSPVTTQHESWGYRGLTDPDEMRRFKEALASAKIPHEVVQHDGREAVKYAREHNAAVDAIDVKLFGTPPPNGRHLGYDDHFKAWLEAKGIPFTTSVFHGTTVIIWAEADTVRVKAYPGFPPQVLPK